MTVLYLVLPLAIAVAAAAVAAFVWTVRSGQLDDVDTPPRRILFDDEGAQPVRTPGGSPHRLRAGSAEGRASSGT